MIVEGQDDALILRKFIKEKSLNLSFDIFGYGADGEGSIPAWVRLLSALGIKTGALFDANAKRTADRLRSDLNLGSAVQVLPTNDIRDKRDCKSQEIIIEGLADENGDVKVGDFGENQLVDILKAASDGIAKL